MNASRSSIQGNGLFAYAVYARNPLRGLPFIMCCLEVRQQFVKLFNRITGHRYKNWLVFFCHS
jgi:hypothetical protein